MTKKITLPFKKTSKSDDQHHHRKAIRPREDGVALRTLLDAPADLVAVFNAAVVGVVLSGAVAVDVAETRETADCVVESDTAIEILGVAADGFVELDAANACVVFSGTTVVGVLESDGRGAGVVRALESDETDVSNTVDDTPTDGVVESTGKDVGVDILGKSSGVVMESDGGDVDVVIVVVVSETTDDDIDVTESDRRGVIDVAFIITVGEAVEST